MTCRQRDDRGATLILAIVFVFAIGLLLVVIGGLAANAMLSTNNLTTLRTSEGDAEATTMVALRYVQTTYSAGMFPGPTTCIPATFAVPSSNPSSSATNPFVVYCSGTVPASGPYNRVVDFYACPAGTLAATCTAVGSSALYLHAQVAYRDTDFGGNFSCSASSTSTCGSSTVLQNWDIIRSDT